MIMSLEQEVHSNMCLMQLTTHDDYQLYLINVLGLEDTSDGDQHTVYTEFKEKLQ